MSFEDVVEKMRGYLTGLKKCPLATPKSGNFPSGTLPSVKDRIKGVYCFYEDGKALYVGRTDNIRERVLQQRRPSGRHNSAAFAFNIAKKEFDKKYPCRSAGLTRKKLEQDSDFAPLFKKAKKRVSKMSVRFVKIEDSIEQAIFEVYAHMKLGTPPRFNDFGNH